MALYFAKTNEDFLRLTKKFDASIAGGIVIFNGRVRRFNHNKEVAFLFYEAYIFLAQSMFADLEISSKKQYGILESACVHRLDRVDVGEDAVIIQVSAPHRNEAFLAARFLIDELKKNIPIWKKEVYIDGSYTFDQGCCG